MKTNIFIIAMIIVLAIASHYGFYEIGKKSAEIKYIRDTDTVTTFIEIRDTVIIPKFTTRVKIDTVIVRDSAYVILDSLYLVDTSYVASLDTVYEDDTAKLRVDFVSPIPLSPKSYFNLDLQIKKELVFVPTYVQDESFWHNRFVPVFGIGGVYTQDGQADLGLFLGFGVRLD